MDCVYQALAMRYGGSLQRQTENNFHGEAMPSFPSTSSSHQIDIIIKAGSFEQALDLVCKAFVFVATNILQEQLSSPTQYLRARQWHLFLLVLISVWNLDSFSEYFKLSIFVLLIHELSPLPQHSCWTPNSQCDYIWSWALGEVLRVGTWSDRVGALIQSERDTTVLSVCHVRTHLQGERRFPPETDHAGTLVPDFQSPEV